MQAIGIGTISRRWLATVSLNVEYDERKQQQEKMLREEQVKICRKCNAKSDTSMCQAMSASGNRTMCTSAMLPASWTDRE